MCCYCCSLIIAMVYSWWRRSRTTCGHAGIRHSLLKRKVRLLVEDNEPCCLRRCDIAWMGFSIFLRVSVLEDGKRSMSRSRRPIKPVFRFALYLTVGRKPQIGVGFPSWEARKWHKSRDRRVECYQVSMRENMCPVGYDIGTKKGFRGKLLNDLYVSCIYETNPKSGKIMKANQIWRSTLHIIMYVLLLRLCHNFFVIFCSTKQPRITSFSHTAKLGSCKHEMANLSEEIKSPFHQRKRVR